MKIVQEITVPQNCEDCISRADAAEITFGCQALYAVRRLAAVNTEAEGLAELEKSRPDLATPISLGKCLALQLLNPLV